ncbi:protein FAR-RED IMPAIRED RESPONSE 1-like [Chenopodium quinoa]|uniref:protein FAR-RED IMPAIRED RESPONSE 1-like n=1 Tax=Chenopodium quinoa TaxID=63459 RepID=UPI000B77597B|nr:protein FAR-RED IMPAIRED RESPONSE 1-like [Chenopodium quinoa]
MQVFPHSRHRLCIWHLIKNAVSRFGALKRDTTFKDAFNKCLTGCVTEEEFEHCWTNMITTYKLENNRWFKRLYSLKEKWCAALSKDFFSVGILSSQRSESANNVVGFKANKITSLTDFFKIFKQTVTRWRNNESDADFKCSNSKPTSNLPFYGMIKHATEVYTHTIFRYFETEFEFSIGCVTNLHYQTQSYFFYEVKLENNEASKQKVTYNMADNNIAYSCKNFEEVGWLCYHCIRVLQHHSFTKIPDRYIIMRWTKYAKAHVWIRRDEESANERIPIKYIPWRQIMARKGYNLILKCQQHPETKNLIESEFKKLYILADEIRNRLEKEEEDAASQESESMQQNNTTATTETEEQIPTVMDPERENTKGRSKRIKGHFEKGKQGNKKKTKAMTTKGDTREFGIITPIQNPKLF